MQRTGANGFATHPRVSALENRSMKQSLARLWRAVIVTHCSYCGAKIGFFASSCERPDCTRRAFREDAW